MSDSNNGWEYYAYPLCYKVAVCLLMPMFNGAVLSLGIFLFLNLHHIFGIFFIAFGTLLFVLTAYGLFMSSSILISDDGIKAANFGRPLKIIRWQDVTKVIKLRGWNNGSYSYEDTYYIFDGNFGAWRERMVNWRGPIVFSERIRKLREVLDKINNYSHRFGFPLFVVDEEAATKLSAQEGAGYWRRVAQEVDEVRVPNL
jgi:hypothetical protein